MDRQIRLTEGMVDDGCDGIHLDIYNEPLTTRGAVEATRRIRDALHEYALNRYKRDLLFTGNLWSIVQPFAAVAAQYMDVIWIESFGDSEADVIRAARVAASLGDYSKPVWYHYQPDFDDYRAGHLKVFPEALFSSCLFEGAVFLEDFKYAVFVTKGPDRQLRETHNSVRRLQVTFSPSAWNLAALDGLRWSTCWPGFDP